MSTFTLTDTNQFTPLDAYSVASDGLLLLGKKLDFSQFEDYPSNSTIGTVVTARGVSAKIDGTANAAPFVTFDAASNRYSCSLRRGSTDSVYSLLTSPQGMQNNAAVGFKCRVYWDSTQTHWWGPAYSNGADKILGVTWFSPSYNPRIHWGVAQTNTAYFNNNISANTWYWVRVYASGTNYVAEIATDEAFTNVVSSATVAQSDAALNWTADRFGAFSWLGGSPNTTMGIGMISNWEQIGTLQTQHTVIAEATAHSAGAAYVDMTAGKGPDFSTYTVVVTGLSAETDVEVNDDGGAFTFDGTYLDQAGVRALSNPETRYLGIKVRLTGTAGQSLDSISIDNFASDVTPPGLPEYATFSQFDNDGTTNVALVWLEPADADYSHAELRKDIDGTTYYLNAVDGLPVWEATAGTPYKCRADDASYDHPFASFVDEESSTSSYYVRTVDLLGNASDWKAFSEDSSGGRWCSGIGLGL